MNGAHYAQTYSRPGNRVGPGGRPLSGAQPSNPNVPVQRPSSQHSQFFTQGGRSSFSATGGINPGVNVNPPQSFQTPAFASAQQTAPKGPAAHDRLNYGMPQHSMPRPGVGNQINTSTQPVPGIQRPSTGSARQGPSQQWNAQDLSGRNGARVPATQFDGVSSSTPRIGSQPHVPRSIVGSTRPPTAPGISNSLQDSALAPLQRDYRGVVPLNSKPPASSMPSRPISVPYGQGGVTAPIAPMPANRNIRGGPAPPTPNKPSTPMANQGSFFGQKGPVPQQLHSHAPQIAPGEQRTFVPGALASQSQQNAIQPPGQPQQGFLAPQSSRTMQTFDSSQGQFSNAPQQSHSQTFHQPLHQGYSQPLQMNRGQSPHVMFPESQCGSPWIESTFSHFPASQVLSSNASVPLGLIFQPLAEEAPGVKPVSVDFGKMGIPRCRICRAYVNPFVTWIENGRRWKCNFCGKDNETGSRYYCPLDGSGQRTDRLERPELHQGCIDVLASEEYMIRAPQPPVFVFVIDVSAEAISSGMLTCAVGAIRGILDKLPGAPRTQVALITFDHALHFYSLEGGLSQPKMMIVSDLDDIFLPCTEDLLANLADSRDCFEMLLDSLPRIHSKSDAKQVATSSAIQAAFRVMVHVGGRMLVFNTKLPTLGSLGKLTYRDDRVVTGKEKEIEYLSCANRKFFVNGSQDISKAQVAVDIFLFPTAYCDVASMHRLCKITGGQLNMYPHFNAQMHGECLTKDIHRVLTRDIAWESVFRVRVSKGAVIKGYFGNFFLRNNDLMQTANADADSAYSLELGYDDSRIENNCIAVQGALLFTSSEGQRRIRVLTKVFPVTTLMSDVLSSANQEVIASFISKKASHEIFTLGPSEVCRKVVNFTTRIMQAVRKTYDGSQSRGSIPPHAGHPQYQRQLELPPNLKNLPYLTMAIVKNTVFRLGSDFSADERSFRSLFYTRAPLNCIISSIMPNFFELSNASMPFGSIVPLPQNMIANNKVPEGMIYTEDRGGMMKLPNMLMRSESSLRSESLILVDDGIRLYIWIGHSVDPKLLLSLFGIPSLEGIASSRLRLDSGNGVDEFKRCVCNIIAALRADNRGGVCPLLFFLKEGDKLPPLFQSLFIDDRAPFKEGNYTSGEWLEYFLRQGNVGPAR